MTHEEEIKMSFDRDPASGDGDAQTPPERPFRIPPVIKIPGLGELRTAISGDAQELDPDVTRVIPRAEGYKYVSVDGEESVRLRLLKETQINDHGIATVSDYLSGITSSLAAVRIHDGGEASLVPLRLERGQLLMDLPSNTPSQIGFFFGHRGYSDCAAILRAGEYSGIPLTTEKTNTTTEQEILIGLGGIKPNETDEQRWADQIGLWDMGFTAQKTRGIFAKSFRETPSTDVWQSQRLIVVPDEMRDLVDHFDSFYVEKRKLQILGYETRAVRRLQPNLGWSYSSYSYGGDLFRAPTRGGDNLGLGFGNAYEQHATTSRTAINRLSAAFDIKFNPIAA